MKVCHIFNKAKYVSYCYFSPYLIKKTIFFSLLQMFYQNCGADISNSGAKFCGSRVTELNSITSTNTSTGGQFPSSLL